MPTTTTEFEHLFHKLSEVLGPRDAVTLMELLADGSSEAASHWQAIQARQ